jgi:hypothetical protein
MAREALIWTVESAYGTIKTSPVLNTDYLPIRLSDGNSFTVRRAPIRQVINTADTNNLRAFVVSRRYQVLGQLKCLAYVGHMPLLLRWALQGINSGQTSPWTTTELPGDLASATLDHFIEDPSAGTVTKYRYTGMKVLSGEAVWNNETDIGMVTMQLVGKAATTHTQTEPADSDYPSNVYCLQDLTTIKIGSTTTNLSEFRVTWNNNLARRFDEAPTLNSCRLRGRNVDFGANLLYKIATDRRAAFTGQTAQDSEFVFTNGANTMGFDFAATNYISSLEDALPLADDFTQMLGVEAFYDTTANTDLTLSFT